MEPPQEGDYFEYDGGLRYECFYNAGTNRLEQRPYVGQWPPQPPPQRRYISPIGEAWKALVGGPIGGM